MDATKIAIAEEAVLIVDPPRVGLHPRQLIFIDTKGSVLYYVACNPKSLARDRTILESGHWTMTDIWTVDLFHRHLM